MKRSDFRILIIEDDPSLSIAMERAFKKEGYTTQAAKTGSSALQTLEKFQIDALVVDCMLPDKNGVDLVMELKHGGFTGPIILTSGIYKDAGYKNDALLKTKAIGFFHKPFDLHILTDTLNGSLKGTFTDNLHPLMKCLKKETLSNSELLEAINTDGSIHGFMLPEIYCLLQNSALTGELEITYENNSKAFMHYYEGQLTQANYPDNKSYFGVLLVEKAYCTMDEVDEILATPGKKKLGEKLVEAGLVSPHVIEIIQKEQASIRISKSVKSELIKVRFNKSKSKTENYFPSFKEIEFSHLSYDLVTTKIEYEWLLQFYSNWMSSRIEKGPRYETENIFLKSRLSADEYTAVRNLAGITIQEALDKYQDNLEAFLHVVHFLFLDKVFTIGTSTKTMDLFKASILRLQKIRDKMQKQNYFEMLGVPKQAGSSEIHRAYQNLAKVYHPDKVPNNAPVELADVTNDVFTALTEAYNNLNSEKSKTDYLKKLRIGEAEGILVAESQFENAYNLLISGRYREARKCFEKTLKHKEHRTDTCVYLTWALLLEKQTAKNDERYRVLQVASTYIDRTSHEDRHSPAYFIARGLVYEYKGNFTKAQACYKSALAIDREFAEARRRLKILFNRYGKKKKTASNDLSFLVTKIFKKKSS